MLLAFPDVYYYRSLEEVPVPLSLSSFFFLHVIVLAFTTFSHIQVTHNSATNLRECYALVSHKSIYLCAQMSSMCDSVHKYLCEGVSGSFIGTRRIMC